MTCITDNILHGETEAHKQEVEADMKNVDIFLNRFNILERARVLNQASTMLDYTKGVNFT